MTKKKNRRNRRQHQGSSNKPPPNPRVPVVVPEAQNEAQPTVASASANEQNESETQELTEAVDRHVRMNTWFAGAIMVATVIQAGVGWFQWDAMKTQNVEMIKQSEAAKGQLDEMVAQSKGAAEQSALVRRQLEIAEGALKTSQDQLKLSDRQAKDTLAQLRLEQRPWVYVISGVMDSTRPRVKPPEMKITFTNRGKSPAYVKSINGQLEYIRLRLIPTPENPEHSIAEDVDGAYAKLSAKIRDLPRHPDPGSTEVLVPGEDSPVWFVDDGSLTQEQLDSADSGTGEIVCIGRVIYEDVNGNSYETTFCWRTGQTAKDHGGELNNMK